VELSPPSNTFSLKAPHLSSHHARDLTTDTFAPQPLNIRKNSSSTNSSCVSETVEDMDRLKKIAERLKPRRKSYISLLHFHNVGRLCDQTLVSSSATAQ
jgi:hypothetical protein